MDAIPEHTPRPHRQQTGRSGMASASASRRNPGSNSSRTTAGPASRRQRALSSAPCRSWRQSWPRTRCFATRPIATRESASWQPPHLRPCLPPPCRPPCLPPAPPLAPPPSPAPPPPPAPAPAPPPPPQPRCRLLQGHQTLDTPPRRLLVVAIASLRQALRSGSPPAAGGSYGQVHMCMPPWAHACVHCACLYLQPAVAALVFRIGEGVQVRGERALRWREANQARSKSNQV